MDGHRQIDIKHLGQTEESKGWQSMGILHYLGLKKEFKGIFKGVEISDAIERLQQDNQDFDLIVKHLKYVPPLEQKFSWKMLEDGRVVKELDFTSFEHGESAIPQSFRPFFGIKETEKTITLNHENRKYEVDIKWTKAGPDREVVRMWWGQEFTSVLKDEFPNWGSIDPGDRKMDMKLVFKGTSGKDIFEASLVDDKSFENEQINFEVAMKSRLKDPPVSPPTGSKNPNKKTVNSTQISRDPDVHAWVLHKSNWICECCNKPSPFTKPDGSKYLEVHHLKRLADGGSDTIKNAIAVCPNCHRELHYGLDKDNKLELIYQKIGRTKKE